MKRPISADKAGREQAPRAQPVTQPKVEPARPAQTPQAQQIQVKTISGTDISNIPVPNIPANPGSGYDVAPLKEEVPPPGEAAKQAVYKIGYSYGQRYPGDQFAGGLQDAAVRYASAFGEGSLNMAPGWGGEDRPDRKQLEYIFVQGFYKGAEDQYKQAQVEQQKRAQEKQQQAKQQQDYQEWVKQLKANDPGNVQEDVTSGYRWAHFMFQSIHSSSPGEAVGPLPQALINANLNMALHYVFTQNQKITSLSSFQKGFEKWVDDTYGIAPM
jgi:hypothetical protein